MGLVQVVVLTILGRAARIGEGAVMSVAPHSLATFVVQSTAKCWQVDSAMKKPEDRRAGA
jgi:hypothetical protein